MLSRLKQIESTINKMIRELESPEIPYYKTCKPDIDDSWLLNEVDTFLCENIAVSLSWLVLNIVPVFDDSNGDLTATSLGRVLRRNGYNLKRARNGKGHYPCLGRRNIPHLYVFNPMC